MLANRIFRLPPPAAPFLGQGLLWRAMEWSLGLDRCERLYRSLAGEPDPDCFLQALFDRMAITVRICEKDLSQIPARGPVVVTANHPFGALEGVVLAGLLRRVRPDMRVMANYLLAGIPQLAPLLIAVDPFEGTGAVRANIGPLRAAIRWVQSGGLLLVFPAGTVSHLQLDRGQVADPPWNRAVARIVRSARAPVVPVLIEGHNRAFFQLAGLIHPRLRTAMLPRELINKQGACIPVRIGRPIPIRRLERFDSDGRMTDYLRWRTYLLEHCHRRPNLFQRIGGRLPRRQRRIAAPVSAVRCRRDVESLPPQQILARSGENTVYAAEADQIPHLLLEIGRLRELTFREVGEGTGQPRDLDGFDAHYLHLFIWNRNAGHVIGAYRIGRTDRILAEHGLDGLYTHTLFRQSALLHARLGPALELGRSFVLPDYQKAYAPLLLLWKGIGTYIATRPRYRHLFGPVSISRDYSDLSRRLIATTLMHHRQAGDLAALVRPRTPLRPRPVQVRGCPAHWPADFCRDIEEVSALVADIELAHRGVPVLLRHYLNLGGRLLAFNLDRRFGNVLDGLILVDLCDTSLRTLERYLGKEDARDFLAFHRL